MTLDCTPLQATARRTLLSGPRTTLIKVKTNKIIVSVFVKTVYIPRSRWETVPHTASDTEVLTAERWTAQTVSGGETRATRRQQCMSLLVALHSRQLSSLFKATVKEKYVIQNNREEFSF
jgi:hypothetical protein